VLGDTAGTGIKNSFKISALTNNGAVKGGTGGGASGFGGVGGIGIVNSGAITNLTNTKTVQGGQEAERPTGNGLGGNGGAGINNSGTIASLTNSGKISRAAPAAAVTAGARAVWASTTPGPSPA
jgi:hypothetical protein